MLKRRFAPTSIPNFLNDPIEALTGTDRVSPINFAKEAADETAPREALRGDFYALIEARKSSTKVQLRCEKLNYFVKRYQTAK